MEEVIVTLNILKEWCKEEGISEDEPLIFLSAPGERAFVLSVYRGDDGKATIDIGESGS